MGVTRVSLTRTVSNYLCLVAAFVLAVALVGCGSDDTSAAQSCKFDSECPLGTVCNYEDKCIAAPCDDCKDDATRVCLVTAEHPEGVCSRPECSSDEECDTAAGETCEDGLCTTDGGNDGTCDSDGDCGPAEYCNLAGECEAEEGCTDADDCADGEYCDTETGDCEPGCASAADCPGEDEICEENQCVPNQQGECTSDADCPGDDICNANNECEPSQAVECDPACDPDTEICNTQTGQCEENTCPQGSPSPDDCANDPVYNKFDPDGCFCAECLQDSDCDTAAGETCNSNGECFVCGESCNPNDGGNACSQDGYYCVSECCVECLGNADCPEGQVCVDGSCGDAPDCSVDPDVCTGNTVCDPDTDTCVPPQTGSDCSNDPNGCPQGQFCDSSTGQCQDLTGGGQCPADTQCNPDCTCPAPSSCIGGFACVGCEFDSSTFQSIGCPAGQFCIPGFQVCM